MSSAEIEAEIKKVLHIAAPELLHDPPKAFGASAGSEQQQSSKTTSDNRESAAKQRPLSQRNADGKTSDEPNSQDHSLSGIKPAGGDTVDAASPKRRNRHKKKPGQADLCFGNASEAKSYSNDIQVQHDTSDTKASPSIVSQPSEKSLLTMVKNDLSASSSGVKTEFPVGVAVSSESSKTLKNPTVMSNHPSVSSNHSPVKTNQQTVTCSFSTNTVLVRDAKPDDLQPERLIEYRCSVELEQSSDKVLSMESSAKVVAIVEEKEGRSKKVSGVSEEKNVLGVKTAADCSKNMSSPAASKRGTDSCTTQGPNENMDKELENNYIFPLKKKSTRFPNAKYFCRLCEYHCDNVPHCQRHMRETRHERLLLVLLEENLLRNMVAPSADHCKAVTQAINDLVAKVAMTKSEKEDRLAVFNKIRDISKKISREATTAIYGSTVSLMALKNSDLNIDLTDSCPAKLLKNLYQALKDDRSGYFSNVISDFQSKVPAVHMTVPSLDLRVQLCVNSGQSVLTSRLMSSYLQLDERVLPLAIAFRHWAKTCRIDHQEEGTLPAYVFGLMTIYFLQQCSPPVLPVLHELLTEKESPECLFQVDLMQQKWQTTNTSDIGKLWIEMLRFYCLELNTTDAVVCVRESKVVKRAEKKWTSKKLAVEDPFSHKRNVARSLSHSQIYEYIDERLRCAYKYFGIVPDGELEFAFDSAVLIPKKGPAVICSICQREGHLKSNCPEETLPPLPRLPPLNRQYINILNNVLYQVFEDFRPREREVRQRMNVVGELQSIVQNTYPGTKLCLFGSSCNGFGFQYSDLDISMTFADHETAENLNCVEIIETLAKKLKRHHGYYNVCAITTAKVPIVKFKHARSQLEGDISLYNTLAQHNTRMLQTYAEIDDRTRILGYTMKVLAKSCDICDASRGSLSSYAYTLMVIYYLQQRKPPVIPVLQELYRGRKPATVVDGWNAWFFEDLKNLHKVWSGYGKNRESLTELWIGLLRFYTEEFNMKEYVVSIRQKEPLTKFEKLWNGNGIAIEDPFNLDHNLGSALSRKMNLYILKVLRNARKVHGTPMSRLDPRYQTMADFLFDHNILTDTPPPNDRGCRRCGKIGHFVNECPLLRKGKQHGREDPDMDEDDEHSHGKDGVKGIPVLITTKDASKPAAVSTAATRKPQSNQPDPVASPDRSQCQSSSSSSDNSSSHGRLGGAKGSDAATESQSPLLNGPLVFHNSKISTSGAPMPSAEVLFGSQVRGGSCVVPTMLPLGFPFIQPPAALAIPSSVPAPWLAATVAANQVEQQHATSAGGLASVGAQVPSLMTLPLTTPVTSAQNAPNKPDQAAYAPPLMSIPFFTYPFYPPSDGNQMKLAQGSFGQVGNLNIGPFMNPGALGQPPLISGQPSQSQSLGQVGQGSVSQGTLLQQPMKGHIQGPQGQGQLVQGQTIQGLGQDHMLQGQAQCQSLQGAMLGQTANKDPVQSQPQVQQFQKQVPLESGNQSSLAAGHNEAVALSKNDKPGQPFKPMNSDQFPNFPVGVIDHPSVIAASPFTMMMALQYQQQQSQRYQELLQASLFHALGIQENSTPDGRLSTQNPDATNAYATLANGPQFTASTTIRPASTVASPGKGEGATRASLNIIPAVPGIPQNSGLKEGSIPQNRKATTMDPRMK